MVHIDSVSLSPVRTALRHFGSAVKRMVPFKGANKEHSASGDELKRSDSEPLTKEERTDGAIKKFNALNEQNLVRETNFFAELDNDFKLLQEYRAYNNPDFSDLEFSPVSSDTVSGKYKGKSVEIKFSTSEDGNKLEEISFHDGSKISYVTFSQGGKMNINGEEFEMPEGTIFESKSVQGRMFSQLIQTPNMLRSVINKPEGLEKAQQVLASYTESSSADFQAVMPTPEYIQNILGNAKSAQALMYFAKDAFSNPARTPENEIKYLEQSIAQGKLPKDTSISGISVEGGKILTIPGENCKYEVCGSEMRVTDNNGETKMIARYESARSSHGLWIVSYDNGKPVRGSHYTSGNLSEPLSTVTYTYNNDNKVTATTSDAYGNKITTMQIPPEGLSVAIDGELKLVSSAQSHLGAMFEEQTSFLKPEELG